MAHTDSSLSASEAPPAAGTSAEKATLIGTLVHLWPYIWPGDRADLKMRVVWSVVLLLAAKLATLSVPFTFKWAIDALTGADSAPVQASNWTMWLIASPLIMTLSYGAIRVLMAVLTQWRDGIFVRVALCAGHHDHHRDLHVLHLSRDRVADRDSPQDERVRHRGEHQGDRLAFEIRDRQIFRRRGARSHALRSLDGTL